MTDPTDYICYDRRDLDQELLKYSVDNTAFWNVCRLTPRVYQTKEKEWVVKYDFDKLDLEILKDNIEYIFNATIDIILAIHTKKESTKTSSSRKYYLELKNEEVPIYEKADATSKVVGTTPKGMTRLDCDYHVTGLQGDGPYWHLSHLEDEQFLYGFIHNDYIKQEG